MRPRDFEALTSTTFDVLVVGGGIHGLATAYEAAILGLKVALVEASDFAAATSFNHQRTAHGGLRSLQSGRVDIARHIIHERRTLARLAPRLLRPLPFLMGTYRSLTRGRLALGLGFRVDRVVGRDRNEGIEPELRLPVARLTSRAATLKLFPGIRQPGLTGGANWYDYQIVHSDRLSIAFAAGAAARGAQLVNYARAIAGIRRDGRIAGMTIRDAATGSELDVHARVVVNTAGAFAGQVMEMFGVRREFPLVRAANLVTSLRASDIALAAMSPAGRMLTLVPWNGRALVGTFQGDRPATDPVPAVSAADVDAWIAEANSTFPALRLTRDAVTLVHRGVVPAQTTRGGLIFKASPQFLPHEADGAPGALTVVGNKYTTARAVGARAAGIVARQLRHKQTSAGDRRPLPGAGIADHEALAIETARAVGLELATPIIRRLIDVYGDQCVPIIRLMAEKTAWRMPLAPGQLAVGAEAIYAIRQEMAMTLADVVIRRTELGAMGYPGDAIVESAATLAGEALGWDSDRRNREIAAVRSFYDSRT